MNANELNTLGEALGQFLNEVIKCVERDCDGCPLGTYTPGQGCVYAVMQKVVLEAEREAENNEKEDI